jgi:hypothetical protein
LPKWLSPAEGVDSLADDMGVASGSDAIGGNPQARARLMAALADEQLGAEGTRDDWPKFEDIPAGWWGSWILDGNVVNDRGKPPSEPREVTIVNFNASAIRRIVADRMVIYRSVRIRAEAVKKLSSRGSPMPSRNLGGRPSKFDWEGYWIEIVKLANTPDGLPDRPKLRHHMQEFISNNWHAQPEESEIRKRLARLYEKLGI